MAKTRDFLPKLPGWLSLKEAAELAGRPTSSIRRAIAQGHLPARRLHRRILIPLAAWQQFVLLSQPPGSPCPPEPRPAGPTEEPQTRILTTLTVPLRAGQQETLEQRLSLFAAQGLHCFPGTLDRSIKLSQSRPDMVLILLVWDAATVPPEEEREAMLAALRTDLADVLDWKSATRYEQHMQLHTL